jgi:hypothetical protein
MATVNKDFKIKSGLVVEGTTGTINGLDILTKKQADQDYIVSLIGGTATSANEANKVVKRDANGNFAAGTITADITGQVSDISNHSTSDLSEGTNLYFTNQRALNATAAAYDAAGSASTAQDNAENYTDTALQSYTPTSSLDLTIDGYGYLKSADLTGYATETYADNAAAAALSDAEDYADAKISDANGTATDKAWSAYKTSTEISLAQTAAQGYADNAVAALVDAAPAMLDTLNELAAALGDDSDFIGTVNQAIGEKVAKAGDTMTGALTLNADPVNALHAATKQYVDGKASDAYNDAVAAAALDATDKANDAEQNAKDYADALTTTDIAEGTNLYFTNQRAIDAVGGTISDQINLLDTDDIEEGSSNLYFTDGRAKTSAADLLTGATLTNITITGSGSGLTITAENGVADSTTDNLTEGTTNKYFTAQRAVDALEAVVPNFTAVDINSVAKQVAGSTVVPVAGIATAYSWLKADYRSAEFLVKVAYGTHTEISKVLITLDTSDNIAITEYGIVGTNGSASTVSATISGNDVQLQVTTVNNTSTVTVVGTLLA